MIIRDFFSIFDIMEQKALRLYKLHKIGIKQSKFCEDMFSFVELNFLNLTKFVMEENPDIIYYMSIGGAFVLKYSFYTKFLYLRNNDFCNSLSLNFNLNNKEIVDFLTPLIKEVYGLDIVFSQTGVPDDFEFVEGSYRIYLLSKQ